MYYINWRNMKSFDMLWYIVYCWLVTEIIGCHNVVQEFFLKLMHHVIVYAHIVHIINVTNDIVVEYWLDNKWNQRLEVSTVPLS